MKQCPKCKSTFTDDSLDYCVSDGAKLISGSNTSSQETLVISNPAQIKTVKVERKNGDILEFSKSSVTDTEEKLIIYDAAGKKIAEFNKDNIGNWWTEPNRSGGYGGGGGGDREPRW